MFVVLVVVRVSERRVGRSEGLRIWGFALSLSILVLVCGFVVEMVVFAVDW